MRNILLLVSMVFANFLAYGQTKSSLAGPALSAPTISALTSPNSVGISHLFFTINEPNASEAAIEIEYSGQGLTRTFTLGPSSSPFNQQIENLSPKTTYGIRVRSLACLPSVSSCPEPSSGWSNLIYMTTLVDFPPAPVLRAGFNCPTVAEIAWDVPTRPEDVNEFLVQRSFDNASFHTLGSMRPNVRSFYDFDALPGRNIFYRVFSSNSSGIKQSNVVMVSVKPYTGPPNPMNVRSDQTAKTTNSLTIKWDNPSEDLACGSNIRVNYSVFIKSPNETQWRLFKDLFRNATSVVIDGLKPKEEIDFRIVATSDKGLQSQWIGSKDQTLGPPSPPTNLIGIAFKNTTGTSSMQLSWKDNSNDEDYFTIDYSLDSINFQKLGTVLYNNTTLTHTPVEEGIKYFYRAKAGNWAGESPYTPITFGIVFPFSSKPNSPYGLKATLASGKVNLKWYDDSNKEQNYILERSEGDSQKFVELKKLNRNSETYIDDAVVSGKTYFYRVKAINPLGESSYSNIAEIKVTTTLGAIENTISLFPNPSLDFVNIEIPAEYNSSKVNISVYDNANNLIFNKNYDSSNFKINLSKFTSGMYNVVIKTDEFTTSKKVYKY